MGELKVMTRASIGEMIIDEVQYRFKVCGAKKDFCIQYIGAESVIFGGTNRVVFHVVSGWRAERGYCTERFLREWDAHYQK